MRLEVKDKDTYIPGTVVYGCAFELSKSGSKPIYHLAPTRGIIDGFGSLYAWSVRAKFYPIGKSGKVLKKSYDIYLRDDYSHLAYEGFAGIFDNEKECIDFYNNLIDSQIKPLEDRLNKLKKLKK